jgi:hypothetical protein
VAAARALRLRQERHARGAHRADAVPFVLAEQALAHDADARQTQGQQRLRRRADDVR